MNIKKKSATAKGSFFRALAQGQQKAAANARARAHEKRDPKGMETKTKGVPPPLQEREQKEATEGKNVCFIAEKQRERP